LTCLQAKVNGGNPEGRREFISEIGVPSDWPRALSWSGWRRINQAFLMLLFLQRNGWFFMRAEPLSIYAYIPKWSVERLHRGNISRFTGPGIDDSHFAPKCPTILFPGKGFIAGLYPLRNHTRDCVAVLALSDTNRMHGSCYPVGFTVATGNRSAFADTESLRWRSPGSGFEVCGCNCCQLQVLLFVCFLIKSRNISEIIYLFPIRW
jgi:hypothetical protein